MTDTLICTPWAQHHVPSVKRACAACGAAIAVSNVAVKAHADAKLLCLACAEERYGDEPSSLSPAIRRAVTARTGWDPGKLDGAKVSDIARRYRQ